jgi:hypothetical protein
MSEELLSLICRELADYSLISLYSCVCKEWNMILKNQELWKTAALACISGVLLTQNCYKKPVVVSEDFLYEISPELLGLKPSNFSHWNILVSLLTAPTKLRILTPQLLNPEHLDTWLDSTALSLLTAASTSLRSNEVPNILQRSSPFIAAASVAHGTFITQVLQPTHLHFWEGTGSNTVSHHVLVRALTIFRLDCPAGATEGQAASRRPTLKCMLWELDCNLRHNQGHTSGHPFSAGKSIWSARALRTPNRAGRTENGPAAAPQPGGWVDLASKVAKLSRFPPSAGDDSARWVLGPHSQQLAAAPDATPVSAAALTALIHPLAARCCHCTCGAPEAARPDPAAVAALGSLRVRIAACAAGGCPRVLSSPSDARAAAALRRLLADPGNPAGRLAGRVTGLDHDGWEGAWAPLPPARAAAAGCGPGGPEGRALRARFAVSERAGGGGRVVVLSAVCAATRADGVLSLRSRLTAAFRPAEPGGDGGPAPRALPPATVWDRSLRGEAQGAAPLPLPASASALAALAPILLGEPAAADGDGGAVEALQVLVGLVNFPGLELAARAGGGGQSGRALSLRWVGLDGTPQEAGPPLTAARIPARAVALPTLPQTQTVLPVL